jgi:hypothetical protein
MTSMCTYSTTPLGLQQGAAGTRARTSMCSRRCFTTTRAPRGGVAFCCRRAEQSHRGRSSLCVHGRSAAGTMRLHRRPPREDTRHTSPVHNSTTDKAVLVMNCHLLPQSRRTRRPRVSVVLLRYVTTAHTDCVRIFAKSTHHHPPPPPVPNQSVSSLGS